MTYVHTRHSPSLLWRGSIQKCWSRSARTLRYEGTTGESMTPTSRALRENCSCRHQGHVQFKVVVVCRTWTSWGGECWPCFPELEAVTRYCHQRCTCTFAQVTLRSMTWCIEHYCKFHISFAIVANRQLFVVNEFPNQDWVGSHFRRKKWNLGEANPHVYYPWDTGTGDVEALWSVGNVSLRCASPWHWIYLVGTLRVQWWLWGTKRSPKFNACLCCARFWRS